MRGKVVRFETERGFGFIRPHEGGDDLFVHITQVKDRQELEVGQAVLFEMGENDKGPCAQNVTLEPEPWTIPSILGALAAAVLLIAGSLWIYENVPGAVLGWLFLVNTITICVYAYDKWVAPKGWRRVPEKTLHGLAVAGGSLGAFLAQQWFRHKTRKTPFQMVFWGIVVCQMAALCLWLWAKSG